MARTAVAVAVVSWNTRDLLARCLASLAGDAQRGLAKVWVVDNASTDGSPELVRERFPWVKLIASDENLGFGRAVNLVARQTDSDWVAPANADIALREGALEALLAAGARDDGAGVIAPRLLLPDGQIQHSVFAFPTVPYSFVLATGAYRLFPALADRMAMLGYWDTERARRVPWAIAAFMLVRRTAWDAVGGFDERQWMYAEDLELGWRLKDAGWATRYEPRAVVDHQSAASTSQLFGPDPAPTWQLSTFGVIARRHGAPRVWLIAVLNCTGALLRSVAAADGRRRRELARWARVQLRGLRGRRALERLN